MRSEIALSAANLAAANAQVAKPVVPGLVTKFNIYFYKKVCSTSKSIYGHFSM